MFEQQYVFMSINQVTISKSTNNALELTNRVIKDEGIKRERLPLARFTVIVFEIVNKWLKERNPTRVNSKTFEHQSYIN